MNKTWYRLEVGRVPPGVLVLDATPEFAPLWHGPVLSLLEELAELSGKAVPPEVAFLGGFTTHALDSVVRALAGGDGVLLAEQTGRCPFLGPLLWKLQSVGPRPVVVVTDSPPLDLADWSVPEITRSVAFYRLTESQPIAPGFTEWSSLDTEIVTVVRHLADPLSQIRVGGAGTVALDWDDPTWKWHEGSLVVHNPANNELVCQFAGPEDASPRVRGTRTSGQEVDLPLTRVPPKSGDVPRDLSRSEGVVLGLWRQGSPYYCRSCQTEHPPGKVRCSGGECGLLSSLATVPAGTVVVVIPRGGNWIAQAFPRSVVPLGEDRVVVWTEDSGRIYSPQGDRWQDSAAADSRFLDLGNGSYAIRL